MTEKLIDVNKELMTNILYLSNDEVYYKVIELTLSNYDVNIHQATKIDDTSFDVAIVDEDLSEDVTPLIKSLIAEKKPTIILKNIINGEDDKYQEFISDNVLLLDKPFEDSDFIETLKKLTTLNIKEVEKMADKEQKENVEQRAEEVEDVLELTDIVEETADEVSDILSNKQAEQEESEETFDDFNLESTEEETSDEILKDEDLDELLSSDKEEEAPKEDDFQILDEEKAPEEAESKEEPEITEEIKPEEEAFTLDTEEELPASETIEDSSEPVKEVTQPEQEEVAIEEPVEEEIPEPQLIEEAEDIQIPIDEETKKLAEEIDNEKENEITDTEEEIFSPEPATKKEVTPSVSTETRDGVDMSVVEKRLLEASEKIIEAIQEATIEIARGIAKATPHIIEEVSKEIIPKIAQKIISDELNKKK